MTTLTTDQISTATNLNGPDLSNGVNDARKYFNNFYNSGFTISAGANDAMVGFFEQYTQNKLTAKNLAAAVMYTAMAQNIDPLVIMSEFESLPKGQLNNYLVAFLNSNRVPTSVLGTKSTSKTSPFITRTILL